MITSSAIMEIRDNSINDVRNFLRKSPLFSTLPHKQLDEIAVHFEPVYHKKGEEIFHEGDTGDSLFIIRSGSVGIYASHGGSDIFVNDLHRGDFFGDMELLTLRKRESTAKAILDTSLYRLKRNKFETLLKENQSIGLYLSRFYAHRIAESSKIVRNAPLPTFYAMTETHPGLGRSHFLYSMAYHLCSEARKRVLIIEIDPGSVNIEKMGIRGSECPDEELIRPFSDKYGDLLRNAWFSHDSGFMCMVVPGIDEKPLKRELYQNMSQIMEPLRNLFDFVFFNISDYIGEIEKDIFRLCDKALVLINNTSSELDKVRRQLSMIDKWCGSRIDILKVGVSHLDGTKGIARDILRDNLNLPETPAIWVNKTREALSGTIEEKRSFPVKGPRALARELGRVRVGLALGAGAALGWAHVGILKVFEEEGIPVDMIAGTSIGALVGAVYAKNASAEITRSVTIDLFPTRKAAKKKIFDYTLPLHGILLGRKAMRLVRNATDGADFLDLKIPAYLVAVDIFRGEEVLLSEGDVSEAVRASISIPGIFNPFRYRGRWMVDGGLLNPVPVDILVQKGANIIIAVCVEQARECVKSGTPSILNVLSLTMNIVHSHATGDFAQLADIVIYPRVTGYAWDDFHRGPELMEAGIKACRKHVDDIKRLIARKMSMD